MSHPYVRSQEVCFAKRFEGPPEMANGGFVAGTLASVLGSAAEVTLRKPVPIERPLRIVHVRTAAALCDGRRVLATAETATPARTLPPAISLAAAEAAAARFPRDTPHPFPHCFVCGSARAQGDGLGLLPGPTGAPHTVAVPWVPDATLCRDVARDDVSHLPDALVWAALDCPGAWSFLLQGTSRPAVLGRITGTVVRRPRVGEPLVVMGFGQGQERRKYFCGTVLYDRRGQVCAYAQSIWIALLPE